MPNRARQAKAKRTTTQDEQAAQKLQAMAMAGAGLIEKWAPVTMEIEEQQRQVLAAMSAALLASYMSTSSSLGSKQAAIMMGIRAAYLYGRCGGVFPEDDGDRDSSSE